MSLGLGLGLDKNRFISTGGFDSDYQAVLDYATTQGYTLPSTAQQELQNQLVLDLKAEGIWDKLDCFSVFATDGNSDFALIDWIRLVTQSAVNSPSFTTNQGFTGDGSSAYISTLYNPATDATNFSLNSVSHGIWVRTLASAFPQRYCGTDNSLKIQPNGDNRINSTSNPNINSTVVTGLIHCNRSGVNNREDFYNGVSQGTGVNSSTLISSDNYTLLALGGANNTDAELSAYFIGGSLLSEQAALYTAINTYLNAI